MLDREGADGLGASGAVDVQDVEAVAGGQADVGLGVAGPPGQDAGPVAGGVGEAVGDQAAQGVLADLGAGSVATRAAAVGRRGAWGGAVGGGSDAVAVGEGVVQGQDRDAPGGVGEGGVAQPQPGAVHGERSGAGWRWRCRKAAALLRPQPAASASDLQINA